MAASKKKTAPAPVAVIELPISQAVINACAKEVAGQINEYHSEAQRAVGVSVASLTQTLATDPIFVNRVVAEIRKAVKYDFGEVVGYPSNVIDGSDLYDYKTLTQTMNKLDKAQRKIDAAEDAVRERKEIDKAMSLLRGFGFKVSRPA